jgi:hypothetical protein
MLPATFGFGSLIGSTLSETPLRPELFGLCMGWDITERFAGHNSICDT